MKNGTNLEEFSKAQEVTFLFWITKIAATTPGKKLRRLFQVFLVAALFPACPLWAGPPFETDDPEPTDYLHWEIYLGATADRQPGDFAGTAPFLSLNYGGFPDTQLSLTQQLSFNYPDGGLSSWGYGDLLAGVKYRFLHENEFGFEAAVYPQVNIPTGDLSKGLGSGQFQVLLPLWFQKSWGPWTSFGGGGYWINPGLGNLDWVFIGLEIQRDFSPQFTLGGEIFFHSANQAGEPDSLGFNLGGYIHFDEINHIVFSAGRDWIQPENQLTAFLAYEWTFPKE
jgi:hypothetical protein